MKGGPHALAALLFSVSCGGLARDPEGADHSSNDGPPPYAGPQPKPPLAPPLSAEPMQPSLPELEPRNSLSSVLSCNGSNATDFAAMRLSTQWDYLALFSVPMVQGRMGDVYTEEASLGARCANAIDPGSCEDAVAAALPGQGGEWTECGAVCRVLTVVLTFGDEVERYDSPAELQALLGPIDTPNEAALWARVNGFRALCDRTIFAEPSDESYLLAVGDPPRECGQLTSRLYLRVMRDGTIIHQRRESDMNTPGCSDSIR
jgi:hypothetical protein